MIPRYRNDAIAEIFSDTWKLNQWRHTELDYLVARNRFDSNRVPIEIVREATKYLPPLVGTVNSIERETGHDVVAFLQAWTADMPNSVAAYIHYGLTSSDLVDNTLFRQLYTSSMVIRESAMLLKDTCQAAAFEHRATLRPGRTHGQLAEVTKLGWRFRVWATTVIELLDEWDIFLGQHLNVIKSPGAVGDMKILSEPVAQFVAEYRHQQLVPSTQVIPRQRVMAWASWCLRLVSVVEEIALEIRLSSRTELKEMRERDTVNRVGSSAMPHKRNPVSSEQLNGLARVARSHFAAIAETAGALHHERDISNSSVERLVVPDLAHITAYSLETVVNLLGTLVVDKEAMADHAMDVPDSAAKMAQLQEQGIPYIVAHKMLRGAGY
jgi:adenylosuccinate lyase